jgi:predicted RNA-binding protein with PUA-like domain
MPKAKPKRAAASEAPPGPPRAVTSSARSGLGRRSDPLSAPKSKSKSKASPKSPQRGQAGAAAQSTPLGTPIAAWVFKSEPEVFSFDALLAAPGRRTGWDGVRNYQARNYLRDQMRVGDLVLYYHSNSEPPAIVGTARLVSGPRPDPTQFDPHSPYFDPQSEPETPRWVEVEIEAAEAWKRPLSLPEMRAEPRLEGLALLAKGSRLSVLPVGPTHLAVLLELAQRPAPGGSASQKSVARAIKKPSQGGSRGPTRGSGRPKT